MTATLRLPDLHCYPNEPRTVHGIGWCFPGTGKHHTIIRYGKKMSRKIPSYEAWERALRYSCLLSIPVDEPVACLNTFKAWLEFNQYDPTIHAVRVISRHSNIQKPMIKLSDCLVIDKMDAGIIMSPRATRNLPPWVVETFRPGKPYRAALTVLRDDLTRHKVYTDGTDPIALHLWAVERKIETLQKLLAKYRPINKQTADGIQSMIDTLIACTKFEQPVDPYTGRIWQPKQSICCVREA